MASGRSVVGPGFGESYVETESVNLAENALVEEEDDFDNGGSDAAEGRAGYPVDLPGSPEAIRSGCTCSVLANSGFRIGVDDAPILDPGCHLHGGTS